MKKIKLKILRGKVSREEKSPYVFSELISEKEALDKLTDKASDALQEFSKFKGDMGLLPDEVRQSDEYRSKKRIFDQEFKKLREVNSLLMKYFKPEMRQRSKEKRGY